MFVASPFIKSPKASTIRLVLLLVGMGLGLVPPGATAGGLRIAKPRCERLFETHSNADLGDITTRSREPTKIHNLTDAIRERNWDAISKIFTENQIPNRIETTRIGKKSTLGITLNLSSTETNAELGEDLLIRMLKRLRHKWNEFEITAEEARIKRRHSESELEKLHSEKNNKFPEIRIVEDSALPGMEGI
jgi:hypothetical protein